jgi:pimeloyl-ACP methyl ester carboxylesterase
MALYDEMLARWPVPYESRVVETRHGATHVLACGDPAAPPLVLLHGTCSNALAWLGDATEYARRFRVYAVDLIGEPGRSAPVRLPYAGPAYADWLSDVLDGLPAPQAALVGLSQGGWLALKFAIAYPERVARMALLAPGGVAPTRLSFVLRAIPLSLLGRRGAEAVNRITFGDTPVHPDAVAFMDVIMKHFKPRVDPEVLFSDEELRRLDMPVLLMAGLRDALRPAEKTAARLQALLPRCEACLLPDAGHVLVGLAPRITPFLLGEESAPRVP